MLSGDVKRVSEEFFKAYLSAVYGRVYGFVASEGVSECSGLVWCRKCPVLGGARLSAHLTSGSATTQLATLNVGHGVSVQQEGKKWLDDCSSIARKIKIGII